MATAGGEDTRRAEKVALKRKLTGPPRLLLGKTRTRSEGEDPPDTGDNEEETEHKTTARCSAAAAERQDEVKEGVSLEGEAPPTGTCRGHCRNGTRCRWWRRFSSELICLRKRKKKVEESLEKEQNEGSVQPEGALQEAEEKSEKKRFKKRAWPNFRRFRTSSDEQREEVQSDGGKPPLTVHKKLHRFFIRGGQRRPPVPQEDTVAGEEAQADGLQAVAVTVSVKPVEDRTATESPEESTAGETEEEVMDSQPETTQTTSEADEITTDAAPVDVEVVSPEKVFCDSAEAVLGLHNQLLISSEVTAEEMAVQTSSQSLQVPANGPSIRIELCPQEEEEEEEEEEECWEGSSSSENHLLLLHLLGFDHSEQRLLQTARSLVRAAMNAAVDQLTREQQSGSNCVQRDHA